MIAVGERLALRLPTPADESDWRELRRASREHLSPWEPKPAPGVEPYSAGAFAAFLESAASPRHVRALAFRREDDALVGQFSLNEIVRGAFHSAYIGYWVGASFTRQGLASEGLQLLVGHAFDTLGLHRVEANVQPTNLASLRLVRRLGFRREGFSPGYLKIAGQWADHERWALSMEDRR